jgi:receptor protein-tyrosine kinase
MHDLGLSDYLHILRRRKWIVLQALIIVPLAAVAFSLRQSPLYQSSADVLLRYQSLPSTLSGISDPNSYAYSVDPTRSTNTSLQVAALPALADRVARALRNRHESVEGVGSSGAAQLGDTDVLRFTTIAGDPKVAAETASEYARQFTLYYQQLDTSSINQAIAGLQQRIASLRAEGTHQDRLDANVLQSKVNQLQTLQTLQTSGAVVVRTAFGATKIRPTPKKYAILGLGLGLVLGIGLAFLRDAFDTRLRSAAQIGAALKMPILGRIPAPTKKLEKDRQLVMLADQTAPGADAYRRLRMNLEFASIGKEAQVIVVSSAVAAEGKSTTFANLAVAMATAGKSVALVDLDLHRPMLSKFFRLEDDQPGLSGVVLGHVGIDDALVPINLDDRLLEPKESRYDGSSNGWNGVRANAGSLVVLPTGILPPDPGEFVGVEGVRHVVAALRDRVDIVLIDAPPFLVVGDGLTIAGFSDAVVVVVRSQFARRPITSELGAMLARLPAAKLGFVLCGDAGLEGASYAYGQYAYEYAAAPEEAIR